MSRIHDAVRRAAEASDAADVPERATFDLRSLPSEDGEGSRWAVAPMPPLPMPRLTPGGHGDPAAAVEVWEDPAAPRPVLRPVGPTPRATPLQAATLGYYRRLVATLTQMKPEGKALTLLVTSAVAGEGKTTTAANVALTFARSYSRRVLLVDGDMRRPQLHEFFAVGNHGGLGACLTAGRLLADAAVEIEPRLMLLTSGAPETDPVSYLSGPKFSQFVQEVSSRFDAVVFDSPPAGLLPDAEIIAAAVQTALVVVEAGRTPYYKVDRVVESIGRERIAGVVLNRANAQSDPNGYYSDAYGYDADTAGAAR